MGDKKEQIDNKIIYLKGAEPELIVILRELNKAVHENNDLIHKVDQKLDHVIKDAFVNGDTKAHKDYHRNVIEWQRLRNSIVREALKKVVSAGALAGAGWLLYAIWKAITMMPK